MHHSSQMSLAEFVVWELLELIRSKLCQQYVIVWLTLHHHDSFQILALYWKGLKLFPNLFPLKNKENEVKEIPVLRILMLC